MKLQVGERLQGTGPAQQPGGYLVTDVVRETPWYGLYTGKKILYNFDFTAKRVRETDDKEWLDVYLRTLHYPRLDDAADVAQRRAVARSEVRILGNRSSNLWPEPIDLLEVHNTRDTFSFPPGEDEREPIVVFARPHGQPLGDWQQSAVPISSLLSVLAELLEFARQAHAEGLVLQGLGPAAILIDRADRVHYIGSDMVTEVNVLNRVRRLFPAERYPRGFAPPEVFDLTAAVSPRSDLYAWGALAYFLFTGHMPWQIALEQGRPWAQFQDSHFERLDRSLRQIPPAHVRAWADQLGLPGAALLAEWPGNFLAMMRALLHPEPARRPPDADAARAWMLVLPPAQVRAALALDAGGGEARVYLDVQPLEAGAEIEVRRAVGQAALQPDQGTLAYSGAALPVVVDAQAPLTEESYYYTVFARKSSAGGTVYSAGLPVRALEPTPDELLALAESEAASASNGVLPPRMALAFRAMDALGLAGILLHSHVPMVRGWALQRLGDLQAQKPSPGAAELLRRGLHDPDPDLRLRAAHATWLLSPDRSDDALVALLHEIGQGDLENTLHAARALRGQEMADEQLQRVIERLEGERPTSCPLCNIPLPRRAWVEHLRTVHDYLQVDGGMLPRALAEAKLWERVFSAGDTQAHGQLLDLYVEPNGARDRYARALEAQMARRSELDEPNGPGPNRLDAWLTCLGQVTPQQPLVERLLRSEYERVRGAGRALVLGPLGERLRSGALDTGQMRRLVEATMPGPDLLGQRIALCRQLPRVGVDAAQAGALEALFREDVPVHCTECGASVRTAELELHLRRAHEVFQFRGERRSYLATRDFLLACVCGTRPDVQAWQTLLSLAEDRHGADAAKKLCNWVCRTIKAVGRPLRQQAVVAVAEAITRAGPALPLLTLLLGDAVQPAWKNLARHLALEVIARLQMRLPTELFAQMRPYLASKDVPPETRQNATAGLLRVPDRPNAESVEILQAYISATSKNRAVERLQALEDLIGQSPVIESFLAALEDRIRMTCPRCQVQLERHDMVGHLWDKHRLVLEGHRVREPWRVLADWVVDYSLEKDPALLARCRELALKTDPAEGRFRLQRLLLSQGVEDREAWDAVVARARQRGVSLCPHCFAQVAAPSILPPLPLEGADRLEGHGYTITLEDGAMTPQLRIDAPAGTVHDGREPGAALTRLGTFVALTGPVVAAAYGIVYAFLGGEMPWVLLLMLAFGLALFLGGLIYLVWPQRPFRARLLEAAWHVLAPELLRQPLTDHGAAFLGSLAVTSVGHFTPDDEVLDAAVEALQFRSASEPGLLALWRLQEQAAEQQQRDPVPLLAERVAQAFSGQVSLRLLGPWLGDLRERLPKSRWVRLHATLCARAAEAGLDQADLADLSRLQPALASAMGGEHDDLAQIQTLWRMQRRPAPWPATCKTIFDLAGDAGAEEILAERHDLLLWPRAPSIYVGTRGVWLKDTCITSLPAQVDVVSSRWQGGEGYEVVAGPHRVWFNTDPHEIADALDQWLRFYYVDFLPQVARRGSTPGSDAGRRLWRANATACPECHRPVVAIASEVGLRVAEPDVPLAS